MNGCRAIDDRLTRGLFAGRSLTSATSSKMGESSSIFRLRRPIFETKRSHPIFEEVPSIFFQEYPSIFEEVPPIFHFVQNGFLGQCRGRKKGSCSRRADRNPVCRMSGIWIRQVDLIFSRRNAKPITLKKLSPILIIKHRYKRLQSKPCLRHYMFLTRFIQLTVEFACHSIFFFIFCLKHKCTSLWFTCTVHTS